MVEGWVRDVLLLVVLALEACALASSGTGFGGVSAIGCGVGLNVLCISFSYLPLEAAVPNVIPKLGGLGAVVVAAVGAMLGAIECVTTTP